MAYDALRTIMPIAGWPEERAREVEISVGAADPVSHWLRGGCSERAERFPRGTAHPDHQAIVARDEAHLEVTDNLKAISSATEIYSDNVA